MQVKLTLCERTRFTNWLLHYVSLASRRNARLFARLSLCLNFLNFLHCQLDSHTGHVLTHSYTYEEVKLALDDRTKLWTDPFIFINDVRIWMRYKNLVCLGVSLNTKVHASSSKEPCSAERAQKFNKTRGSECSIHLLTMSMDGGWR